MMKFSCKATILACIVGMCFANHSPSAADYKVNELKGFGIDDDTYAGLMPISLENNKEGSLFFWLAKRRETEKNKDTKEKLLVWLNGGPGCSSTVGMLWENGPFTIHSPDSIDYTTLGVNETLTSVPMEQRYALKSNPFSWNEVAHVLYVEQPIRTGFSVAAPHAKMIKTEEEIGIDFRNFLISFIHVFPEFKDMDLFISGESYAGAYIPSIANEIVKEQLFPISALNNERRKLKNDKVEIDDQTDFVMRDTTKDHLNLKGIAIGNGVIDYMFQEPSYAEYAYTHGLIPLGAKNKFDHDWLKCLQDIQMSGEPVTRGSFGKCEMMHKVLEAAGFPNEYNTATFKPYTELISKGYAYDRFFQDPDVQTMIHVRGNNLPGLNFKTGTESSKDKKSDKENGENFYAPPHGWSACNLAINDAMTADHPTTMVPTLQFLTEKSQISKMLDPPGWFDWTKYLPQTSTAGIRVMLYSGEFDLNCNTLGTLHTLEANNWRDKPWNMAERSLWRYNEDVAGEYFDIDGIFSFLIVRNSGHLLPMDLPDTALDMISRFLDNRSFADTKLPSEAFYMQQEYSGYSLSKEQSKEQSQDSSAEDSYSNSERKYEIQNNNTAQLLSWVLLVFGIFAVGFLLVLIKNRLNMNKNDRNLNRKEYEAIGEIAENTPLVTNLNV